MEIKKLDLHGVKHEDARNDVIRFIEQHFNQDVELEIMTGHSPLMRLLVVKVIDEYNLEYRLGRLYEVDPSVVVVWY